MKVLVVDDSHEQMTLLKVIIERLGHEFVSATSCQQASSLQDFEIALIDQNLEDGQGIDLIKNFKTKNIQAKYYLISATKPDSQTLVQMNSFGVEFIQKPLTPLHRTKILR